MVKPRADTRTIFGREGSKLGGAGVASDCLSREREGHPGLKSSLLDGKSGMLVPPSRRGIGTLKSPRIGMI